LKSYKSQPILFLVFVSFVALTSAVSLRDRSELSPLAKRIRHALVTLPYYTVFDYLEFRLEGSEVTLMGQVTRPSLRDAAEAVVKGVSDVTDVENKIEVLPVSAGNDDRIRIEVYRAIYYHPRFTRYAIRAVPPIHIIVKRGDVTLEGVVASERDKDLVNIRANGVAGVFSVTNNLVVVPD
jgi:hyperosmotically inducible protein